MCVFDVMFIVDLCALSLFFPCPYRDHEWQIRNTPVRACRTPSVLGNLSTLYGLCAPKPDVKRRVLDKVAKEFGPDDWDATVVLPTA